MTEPILFDPYLDTSDSSARPPAPGRAIPITDELRARDAAERAARGERKPPVAVKPRPSERELDAHYHSLDPQEKYWLFESAAAWLALESRTA